MTFGSPYLSNLTDYVSGQGHFPAMKYLSVVLLDAIASAPCCLMATLVALNGYFPQVRQRFDGRMNKTPRSTSRKVVYL
jgi:hypothetical protein